MKVSYTVHFEPTEEGGYSVTVPALPGCFTEGLTFEEAKENAGEAILAYIDVLIEDGKPIPLEAPPSKRVETVLELNVPALA
ncbi:MAG: hypothetical protein GHCLOJNM_04630 [bacterium]|nr:hypothetical protein [bacterium]